MTYGFFTDPVFGDVVVLGDRVHLGVAPSWLRTAASAWRPDPKRISRAEVERRWLLDGEVTYLVAGDDVRIIEPNLFDEFREHIHAQIAKAFGGRVK